MNAPNAALTLSDLMAKTGYFLLYWSMFERALGEAIVEMRIRLGEQPAPVSGGLKDRLAIWVRLTGSLPENASEADAIRDMQTQALLLRDARNLIVHGLDGGDAQPKDGGPGYISCIVGGFEAPTDETVRYTVDDLEHLIQGADACRRACIDIRYFNYRI